MDLSGYKEGTSLSQFRNMDNKKVPGKFSDELPTEIIREVIVLKPKMYSILTKQLTSPDSGHTAKAKGVSRTAKKHITHENYRSVLKESGTSLARSRAIRTLKNNVYTVNVCKRALSAFDDKKFILDNGVDMLSYGHYKLR